jgi:hypothetical protein
MTENEKTGKKPQPPKGGRKGGTTFPRLNLKKAPEYADKLVGKTHTAPQPAKTILPGVFGNAGPEGGVRASALKQYGLLEGPKSAYQATKLAKDISAAPEEDRRPLLRGAFLNSKLFKQIFDTFHGDTVPKAKVKQLAQQLDVHPDSADECVDIFIDSAVVAGLGTLAGDSVALIKAGEIAPAAGETAASEGAVPPEEPETAEGGTAEASAGPKSDAGPETEKPAPRANRAGVNVTLTVDSSSDPDKLQKQIELLRKFGVI